MTNQFRPERRENGKNKQCFLLFRLMSESKLKAASLASSFTIKPLRGFKNGWTLGRMARRSVANNYNFSFSCGSNV